MIFNRTYRFKAPLPMDQVRQRLLDNQHLKVHHLDFEIIEKDNMVRVIPHAENLDSIKTLPITHVSFNGDGDSGTRVILKSKPRRIDAGGPYLIILFCLFCVIGASIFYFVNPNEYSWPSLVMIGIGILIFIIFWINMEIGYFDYTRKIRNAIQKLTR
jgi:hypothetical protein